MKKLVLLLVAVCACHAQNFTTVTATRIQDASGNPLASGQLCFVGVSANGTPLPYRAGSGGMVHTEPVCVSVTSGAILPIQIANSDHTAPLNVAYLITLTDTTNGNVIMQVGPTQINGAGWSLDTFVPNQPALALIQTGPQGPPGPVGVSTANGTNGGFTVPGVLSVGTSFNGTYYAGNTYTEGTTIQAAIDAAGISGSVQIPPTYGGTDSYINSFGISILDLRTAIAFRGVISVKDYGARGDGSTDDTTTIQQAIAALGANGGTLYFPPGNYLISAGLNFDSTVGIKLAGAGMGETAGSQSASRITYTGTGTPISARSTNGFAMQDLQLMATNPLFTGTMIDFSHATSNDTTFALISHCLIIGQGSHPAIGVEFNQTINSSVEYTHFQGMAVGIRGNPSPSYANAIKVDHCTFNSPAGTMATAGIQDPGAAWVISNNTFEMGTAAGNFSALGSTGYTSNTGGVVFQGNYIGDFPSGSTQTAIVIGGAGWTIQGNLFAGPATAGTTAISIISALRGASIHGNKFTSHAVVYAWGAASIHNVDVFENDYYLNTAFSSGSTPINSIVAALGASGFVSTLNGYQTDAVFQHIGGNTAKPTIAAGSAAGTSPTVTLYRGTDTGGVIYIHTGGATTTGTLATVTFNQPYATGSTSVCTLTPYIGGQYPPTPYAVVGSSATTFGVGIGTALTSSQDYYINYVCVQTTP